jgi:predicted site-specific integrase-resolvase
MGYVRCSTSWGSKLMDYSSAIPGLSRCDLRSGVALYERVSSADQKPNLDREAADRNWAEKALAAACEDPG